MWFISHHSTGRQWKALAARKLYLTMNDRADIGLYAWLNAIEDHFERGKQRIDNEPSECMSVRLRSVTNHAKVISVHSKAQDRAASKEPLNMTLSQSGAYRRLYSYSNKRFEIGNINVEILWQFEIHEVEGILFCNLVASYKIMNRSEAKRLRYELIYEECS